MGFGIQYVYKNHRTAIIQCELAVHYLAESVFSPIFTVAQLLYCLSVTVAQNGFVALSALTRQMYRSGTEYNRQTGSSVYSRHNASRNLTGIHTMFICHVLHLHSLFIILIQRSTCLLNFLKRSVKLFY